ncbi:MAG: DUF3999 domain-containing protein [Bacteroidota bacterium]|nr:DUF3999 domain-containing protein [Bacteroidota bacterium]
MMRISQRNKVGFLLTALCTTGLFASAQKIFKYKADLQKVDSSGFYRIGFRPGFVAKSNPGLTDIRITDARGNFVSYITPDNLPRTNNEKFIVFPEIKLSKDTGTAFIIESKEKLPVNRLWLKLKNTAVRRTVNLSGSDDLQRWFAIEEEIPLQEAALDNDGSYLQSLSFPASNYHYLKVLVNDKNKAPVKFLEAGIYTEQAVLNRYFPIPNVKFAQRDSNKTTRVTIQFDDNYLVNMLRLTIAGPKYYKRDITVYAIDKQGGQLISNTELNSGKNGALLMAAKTNKIELQIDNGDNLPLDIKEVEAMQSDQFIAAYLEKGQSYKLYTGNINAVQPVYDLKFFADSIHGHLPEISHGPLIKKTTFETPAVQTQTRDHTIAIWVIIVGALLMLSLLTLRMMREIDRKNKSE